MVELQGPNVQYQTMTLLTFDCPVVPRCLVSNDFNIDPVPWDPVDLTCYMSSWAYFSHDFWGHSCGISTFVFETDPTANHSLQEGCSPCDPMCWLKVF